MAPQREWFEKDYYQVLGVAESATEKEKVEQGLSSLKEALAGTDLEAIRRATESLVTASQEFASRLYEQAGPSAAAGGQAGGEPGGQAGGSQQQPADDEVVDAEIVDEGEHGHGRGA